MAERLEHVREHVGIPSLRGFWNRLAEGWPKAQSYEAVRTYHYDRAAPVTYLERVVEVFPQIRFEWLARGKGKMTWAEEALQNAERSTPADDYAKKVEADLRRDFAPYDDLSDTARAAIWEAINRFVRSEQVQDAELPADDEHPDPMGFARAAALGLTESLSMPMQHFGWNASPAALSDYVTLACQAVARLIPSPAERMEIEARRERELDEKAARAPELPPAGTPERKAEIEKRRKRYREVAELSRKHGKLDPEKDTATRPEVSQNKDRPPA